MTASSRVLILGLDCATPQLAFDRYEEHMPHLRALRQQGTWGSLRTVIPPITVPAWASMITGKDPGQLGIYGFRQRTDATYELHLVSSDDLKTEALWDWLAQAGKRSAFLFVPPTFPPKRIAGEMVSCFLTPSPDVGYTWPESLKAELEQRFGPYAFDVAEYRTDDKRQLLNELYSMTEQHFAIARYVWESRRPELMMMVEIGLDRFHHAFLSDIDPRHPNYVRGNAFERAGRDYYAFLDTKIGELLAITDEHTTILVVSDHGAKPLVGTVGINEWLIQKGYLVLRHYPSTATRIDAGQIDWSKTQAWGEGGYYARVFLNVEGREPQGAIPKAQYEETRQKLRRELSELRLPYGPDEGIRAWMPEELYREVRGNPPDLLVVFGDLGWRPIGTVGHGRVFMEENDSGPDGCNHDWDGIFVLSGNKVKGRGRVEGLSILDVAPTVLGVMDLPIPSGLAGRNQGGGW